jgi:hypothetical protein
VVNEGIGVNIVTLENFVRQERIMLARLVALVLSRPASIRLDRFYRNQVAVPVTDVRSTSFLMPISRKQPDSSLLQTRFLQKCTRRLAVLRCCSAYFFFAAAASPARPAFRVFGMA